MTFYRTLEHIKQCLDPQSERNMGQSRTMVMVERQHLQTLYDDYKRIDHRMRSMAYRAEPKTCLVRNLLEAKCVLTSGNNVQRWRIHPHDFAQIFSDPKAVDYIHHVGVGEYIMLGIPVEIVA